MPVGAIFRTSYRRPVQRGAVQCLWGRGVQKRGESYRLYSGRGCSVLVSICGRCDRGNIYCPGECAAISRRASNRRAGARYQRTRRGVRRHAARQWERREREIGKVTQQGCAPAGPVFTMFITVDVAAIEHLDEPAIPQPVPVSGSVPKRDYPRHREAGGSCTVTPDASATTFDGTRGRIHLHLRPRPGPPQPAMNPRLSADQPHPRRWSTRHRSTT